MSRRLILNLLQIFFLALMFLFLWIFNQKINYRKVFTLNTKFSINSNDNKPADLSNPSLILNYLNSHGISATLTSKVITNSPYIVLGRELTLTNGSLEIYEFNSPNDVAKLRKNTVENSNYKYKNLVIIAKTTDPEVIKILERLLSA